MAIVMIVHQQKNEVSSLILQLPFQQIRFVFEEMMLLLLKRNELMKRIASTLKHDDEIDGAFFSFPELVETSVEIGLIRRSSNTVGETS